MAIFKKINRATGEVHLCYVSRTYTPEELEALYPSDKYDTVVAIE